MIEHKRSPALSQAITVARLNSMIAQVLAYLAPRNWCGVWVSTQGARTFYAMLAEVGHPNILACPNQK